ncbi:DUF3347 domain-containing protein [Taibaiella lutea]|uniref:DUF3347 domain-containing protein n=1 Tax=Taibaiella lutea TaxID=2608001 RepID=A0A5M6CAX8_9BACT|nr:DUF3347 domain-containing protein [Taibaiella lutea]KAA5532328.1 DUF3347 domain-containing protein [Taibaiella lutea]
MSLIKTFCLFILILFLMASCKEKPKVIFNVKAVKSNLAPDQSETMGKVINDYLSLKNALVATDEQQAKRSAIAMQNQMKAFKVIYDSASVKHAIQVSLFSELISMDKNLSNIVEQNDKSCEPQRIYFKNLSDSLYAFVKNHETTRLQLYRYYCPMALNGKGGWWLSTSKKVENPYFGSKMLTCGELVDTLQ